MRKFVFPILVIAIFAFFGCQRSPEQQLVNVNVSFDNGSSSELSALTLPSGFFCYGILVTQEGDSDGSHCHGISNSEFAVTSGFGYFANGAVANIQLPVGNSTIRIFGVNSIGNSTHCLASAGTNDASINSYNDSVNVSTGPFILIGQQEVTIEAGDNDITISVSSSGTDTLTDQCFNVDNITNVSGSSG